MRQIVAELKTIDAFGCMDIQLVVTKYHDQILTDWKSLFGIPNIQVR